MDHTGSCFLNFKHGVILVNSFPAVIILFTAVHSCNCLTSAVSFSLVFISATHKAAVECDSVVV